LNITVLVGVVDKVKEFYDLIPSAKKEFFVMQDATHSKIPLESWEESVFWSDKTLGEN